MILEVELGLLSQSRLSHRKPVVDQEFTGLETTVELGGAVGDEDLEPGAGFEYR